MTKLDIAIAVPGLPFNGQSFDKLSIGGSESAGYYMARALAKLGHRVTCFANTPPVRCPDVDYLPISMFKQFIEFTVHDVCIVQRAPELFSTQHKARYAALWCHDLALKRQQASVLGTAWNFDKVFVLSQFQREQYKTTYDLPDEILFNTRNGVDLETVERVKKALLEKEDYQRNPLSLVYSARPERGVDVLLGEIMPRILRYEPNAKLYLSTYNNPVDHLSEFYKHCANLARPLGDRVVMLGHLTKEKLYEVYHAAGMYVYPVPSKMAPGFDEISCISAMEAQACGLPFIGSARGALPETLAPGAGALISEAVHTPAYYDAFADACLKLMRSPFDWEQASNAGLEHAKSLDWDGVAREWTELFEREIRAKSSDLATLANHFWRRSDIYAARECLKRIPTDDEKSRLTRERVKRDYEFLDQPDGFRAQYEKIGSTHDARVLEWSPQEPRYVVLRDWLSKIIAEMPPEAPDLTILDYGCAHGGYAINLLKELPRIRITGVDIDQHGIEMAYAFAEKMGVSDRFAGVVGDLDRLTDPNLPEMREMYDIVLAQEVLEHVSDPTAVLKALEQRVKHEGIMYATVPFGPWEYTDYLFKWGGKQSPLTQAGYTGYPYRAHIWEFDLHDLHDMLDVKGVEGKVAINVHPFGHSAELGEPLGWHIVQYAVTDGTRGSVGTIDMERKLWLQRPRQTVSLAIMAGGVSVEETLHWCLRSVGHVVDEVIIADCGLTAEAHRLLETYDERIKVIKGVDPKREGFEVPRNMALAHCTQDWVMWLDTDEKLLQPERLTKYLRANIFNGYGLRQHHFAVDTHFEPDMPIRVFRNPAIVKNGMRWYGCIHEHPETELNAGPGRTLVITDVCIPHLGYFIESGRQARFQRNLPMLQKDMEKYPDRKLQKHFVMRDLMLICAYELQQSGGQVTEEIKTRAREVIRLYREHFLGKGHFTNADPLQYYAQALQLLGEGFDVTFQFSADKIDAKPNGTMKARFANTDDLLTEMTKRIKDQTVPLEHRYL